MVGRNGSETLAVLCHARFIQIGKREVIQNAAIGGLLRLIGQHSPHLVSRAMIVALVIPPVSARDRVLADVHRSLAAVGSRNIDDQYSFAFHLHVFDILIDQQVEADFSFVANEIPEVLFDLRHVVQSAHDPISLDAQHDAAAIGVRQGTIGFPQAPRDASLGRLEFPVLLFTHLEGGEKLLFYHCSLQITFPSYPKIPCRMARVMALRMGSRILSVRRTNPRWRARAGMTSSRSQLVPFLMTERKTSTSSSGS